MKKTKKCLIGLSAILLLSSTSFVANASCFRHIYNHSGKPWTFEFLTFNGEDVKYISSTCVSNHTCTVRAGGTVEIYYGSSNGILRIKDHNGVEKKFTYSGRNCGSIRHEGKTGSVTMNDPTGGDIRVNTGADQW